jgi:hypothetical protein
MIAVLILVGEKYNEFEGISPKVAEISCPHAQLEHFTLSERWLVYSFLIA